MSVTCVMYRILPSFAQRFLTRVAASPLGYRLSSGIFWNLAGACISRGLALLASICVARMIGRELFGELGIIQSTAGMFGVFAGFGLGLTATKHVAEFHRGDPARAGRIIALTQLVALITGLTIALLLILLAPWLAARTLAAPGLTSLLRIGSGLILLGAVTGAQTGALAGFEAFKSIAKVNLVSGLLAFPLLILGTWYGGLNGAVWGLNAGLLIIALLNLLALRREARIFRVPLTLTGSLGEWRILSSFSLLAMLGGVVVGPVTWLCNMLLVNQPRGYAEMGLFNAGNQWRIAVMFLPGMIGEVAMPLLANLYGDRDEERYRKVLHYSLLLNGITAVLLALPLVACSRFLLAGYGPAFRAGQFVFVVLVLSAVIISLNNALSRAIASTGRMWADFSCNLVWGSSYLLLGWWLIPQYGSRGLAMAALAAAAVQACCQWCYIMHRRKTAINVAPEPAVT